ncbi:MAG TPA: polysaccharide lyase family protein [Terriglobia bacterium]|nr:polysaccharide lyase family protein [Terriglobia bacterium]
MNSIEAKALNRVLAALLFLVTLAGFSPSADAVPRVLWRIGRFDLSSGEFNQSSATGKVVYIVGQSTPKADWPAFQAGSANGKAGDRLHPYTIQFDLGQPPKGLCVLKIGMLVQTKRLSILQIGLNGHQGWVYQEPHWIDVPGEKHWEDVVPVELPSKFMRAGTNKLVLTAVDEPSQRDDINNPGITYDALELDQNPEGKFISTEVTAQVQPTIFYQRKGGQLTELVDVLVHHNSPARNGHVTLVVGKQRFTQPLLLDSDFGEQRVEFAVPEFTSGTHAVIITSLHGPSRRFPVVLTAAKKWRIYVVPHEHLDVGYTDYQSKVAEIQSRVLDEAAGMIRDHPGFRYSPDSYWVLQQFFAGRDASDRERVIRLIQEKKIFIPAEYANELTGFPAVETLIRSLYPSFRFDRKNGEDFDYANITDVPSYTWSYASILAAAGVKYFLAGCDQIRGPILDESHLQERSPFWWEGPDGQKVLMWYSNGYGQVGNLFGMPPQAVTGRDALPRFLETYPGTEYKPDTMLLFGAQGENSDLYPQQATFLDEWNKIYAYPSLRYSGFAEALAAIAGQEGNSIPVFRGDGGPYWEDGIASDAYFAAMNRESEQRALSAEDASTLSSLLNPRVRPAGSIIRRMWQDLVLYDEHTWGAAGSVSSPKSEETVRQLAVKDAFAVRARQELEYVLDRGLAAIADKIHDPSGTWVVFNPLNWQRDGLVETDLPKGFEIVDLVTHQAVPYEVLPTSGSTQRIRFMAQGVPSLGYKCYTLKAQSQPPSLQARSGDVLENKFYRVVLDPESGSVKSIFDKQLQRNLVNSSSPYRFDQYLYVTGGDQPAHNRLLFNQVGLPMPTLTVNPAGAGRGISITRQPFGMVARLESAAVNTPRIETEIVLFDDQKKIEFINRVRKTEVYTKEGVYFAFPFSMDHPEFRYEIQNGYVDPAHDQLPGAGKEWFSVQHWVEAKQGNASVAIVPLDASLVTLGDIVRGTWPLNFGQRNGTVFSYVMNNYWFTNYRAGQGGDFTFRYVLTSGRRLDPAALSRLGWAEMTPLEVDAIIHNDKATNAPEPLDAASQSFLQVSQPNVVLVTWKRAEDKEGTILRFLEVGGRASVVNISTPVLNVQSAWMCNAMEQKQQALPVSPRGFSFSIQPFQIATVRVAGTRILR